MMKFLFYCILAAFVLFKSEASEGGYAFTCTKVKDSGSFCPEANSFPNIAANMSALVDGIKKGIEDGYKDIESQGLPQKCNDALKKFVCLFIPQCKSYEQLLNIDLAKIQTECEKTDESCGEKTCENLRKSLISQFEKTAGNLWKCSSVQDSTGYCPNVKYKVAVFEEIGNTQTKDDKEFKANMAILKNELDKYKANISSNCSKSVKEFGCYLARGLICSDNEKYFMSPISREECSKRLQCLPVSYDKEGEKSFPHAVCDGIPLKNARRVPIPSGVPEDLGGNDVGSNAMIYRPVRIFIIMSFLSGVFFI